MDDGRFDAVVRVLGASAERRRVLAGLLATLSMARGWDDAAAKKCKKGKKACGDACIPKFDCCTDDDCGAGEKCSKSGACICARRCKRKQCGDDGCGGSCGSCSQFPNSTCTAKGKCVCEPDCTGKQCGDDGCGSTCGSCENGSCSNDQCVCAQGAPCGPDSNICCLAGTTCRQDGSACCRTSCAGRCGIHRDTCDGQPLDCGGCASHLRCSDLDNGGTCACPQRRRGGVQIEIPGCDGF